MSKPKWPSSLKDAHEVIVDKNTKGEISIEVYVDTPASHNERRVFQLNGTDEDALIVELGKKTARDNTEAAAVVATRLLNDIFEKLLPNDSFIIFNFRHTSKEYPELSCGVFSSSA